MYSEPDSQNEGVSLSRQSVGFFKHAAKTRRVRYQRIIRALVDAYAEKQAEK